MVSPAIRKFALVGVCFLLTCCALVKPDRRLDEVTPIDWGLDNSFESAITVRPFDAQDEKWGTYAANRMKQHLLESSAFRREPPESPTMTVKARIISPKYSGGPNFKAWSARKGAKKVSPITPKLPAMKDPIAATPRAGPPRPCWARG